MISFISFLEVFVATLPKQLHRRAPELRSTGRQNSQASKPSKPSALGGGEWVGVVVKPRGRDLKRRRLG